MKRICQVCGKETDFITNKMVKNTAGQDVCKDCLKKANISQMKYGCSAMSPEEVKAKIEGVPVNDSTDSRQNSTDTEQNQNQTYAQPTPVFAYAGNGPTKKCKFCQSKIPKKAKLCPVCRKKQGPGAFKIIFITAAVIFVISIAASFSSEPSEKAFNDNDVNEVHTGDAGTTEENEKVIYSDDNFKITYIGLNDPKVGLTLFNMSLRLENNSDKSVIISLNESYINDTAVQFLGGNIDFDGTKPNKKSVCTFSFGYDKMGIETIDDITKVEFKIELRNADGFSDVLLETDVITLLESDLHN